MLKKVILTIVLTLGITNTAFSGDYYAVYNYEDCVMPDKTIRDTKNWFNAENIMGKLIHPAIIKTNNVNEKADMTIYELQKLSTQYLIQT